MPNRIIKESICTSEEINSLSQGAEILFYRLLVKADDFGIYFGNPQIIKNTCYPLKSDDIKLKQVCAWLDELINCKLIFAYDAENGKRYIRFTTWEKHQQIRAKKSKFPMPDIVCNQLISDDSNCHRNPIQSKIENPIIYSEQNDARQEDGMDEFFDSVWKLYPRKSGKSAVTKKAKKELAAAGYDVVAAAVNRYAEEMRNEHREMQYIKNGSTFFNGAWKDYAFDVDKELEPDYTGLKPWEIAELKGESY